MEEIIKIYKYFLDGEFSENWIKENANNIIQEFNKSISGITKISSKEKQELRTIRQSLYNLKSKAENLGMIVDELKTINEVELLPLEKLEEIGNKLKNIDYNNDTDIRKIISYIPEFNQALKELDNKTAFENQIQIRQIKYKLRFIRNYIIKNLGVKEENIEPLFNKTIII